VVRGTIEGAALAIAAHAGVHAGEPSHPAAAPVEGARLVGLYTGGTLAYEALTIARRAGLEIASNLSGAAAPSSSDASHRVIDLGDDAYTRGRPHPMIDPDTRAHALTAVEDDADLVLLLDCVLGTASHHDPAGALAAALVPLRTRLHAAGRELHAYASVTGTEGDRQKRSAQVELLEIAGVHVAPSNAAAVRAAIARVR
jgi:FdrA protein